MQEGDRVKSQNLKKNWIFADFEKIFHILSASTCNYVTTFKEKNFDLNLSVQTDATDYSD